MVHGTKVIYVHIPKNHQQDLTAVGNILKVPGEKNNCKDLRIPDKTGKCVLKTLLTNTMNLNQ